MRKQEAACNKNGSKWGIREKWVHMPWYLQFQLCYPTSLNKCNTDSKETRSTLCSVQLQSGEERQEIKSVSCNAKNAAKLKDPSNTTVKGILVFFLLWLSAQAAGERCAPSKAETSWRSYENLRGSTFPLGLFLTSTRTLQHVTAKLSLSQRSSQRTPRNFSHLLKDTNQRWRAENHELNEWSTFWFTTCALGWQRNCTLLPWFWKGVHRFCSPASRSICPPQVKGISIMTNTGHKTAGGYKLSLSAHNPTKSGFVAYQISQKMQYHYAEKHEVAFCKGKLLKWVSKQCFC